MTTGRPRRTRMAAGLVLAAIFLLGMVAGAMVTIGLGPRPPGGGGSPIPEHLAGLDLTAEQERRVVELHERYRPELDAILQGILPEVRAVQERIEGELFEILTPEQLRELEEIKARRAPPGGPEGHPPPPGFGPPPPR